MTARTALHLAIATALTALTYFLLPLDAGILTQFTLDAGMIRAGLALLVLAAYLWLTEALPIPTTALLIPLLAVFMVRMPVESALAPFADPIIFLFLGGFVIAGALSRHQLDHWIATGIIRVSGGKFILAASLLIVATAVISMWISNTATAAMMLPLGLGLCAQIQAPDHEQHRATMFLLLGIAFAASIGGVGTVVGTPPNGITARALGLDFNGWLRYGLPAFGVMLPVLMVVLLACFRPSRAWRVRPPEHQFTWNPQRVLTLGIFCAAVLLWLLSAPLSKALGLTRGFDSLVAMAALIVISMGKLLSWKEIEDSIEWGVLLLFGGGMTLGKLLEDTGASLYLAREFTQLTQGLPLPLLLLALITIITILSEFASNVAIATLMVPIFAKVAVEMGLPPAKLVIPVGLAASCGFMLPVATPPNALVYGTGRIPQRDMIRAGFWLDLGCIGGITLLSWLVF